ncbi:MAG: CPBP family glutamic-type intramembrane protease [Sphingomicrobium sp.]
MWGEWARFVLRPVLPLERERFGARAVGEVGQLLSLNVLIDLVLVVGLSWLATRLGIKTPEFGELKQYGPVVTLAVGALGLPILEECVFRGWLTGKRRMLWLVLVLMGAVGSLLLLKLVSGGGQYKAIVLVLIGWTVVVGLTLWRAKGEAPAWFARAFPGLFFASAVMFGLAHVSNYDLSRPWLLLPFVVPQTIAGLIFGFARVRYGMWANIALHATSNALFLGLSLVGM